MAQNKLYALLIGVNEYQSGIKFGKEEVYFPKLSGCAGDATKIGEYLKADTFYETDIKVMKNSEATKAAVVGAISDHLGKASENDTVFLYFSGHGIQEYTDKEVFDRESDGKLECIACYYDENTKDDFLLSDKELRWLIHKIAQNKPHIVTIFDCCHSGENTRNAALLVSSYPRMVEKSVAYIFPERNWDKFIFSNRLSKAQFIKEGMGKLLPEGKHFQFSACESNESAIEMDNEGVFTKTLLRVLKDSGGDLTYSSLGSRIRQYMRNVFAQKPKIESVEGSTDDLNKIFLNKPFSESKKAFGEITFNDKNGWQLNLGAINGLGSNTSFLEIFDSGNTSKKIKAAIKFIGVDYSILTPDEQLDPAKIYTTNIEGLTSETLLVHFDMEDGVLSEQKIIFDTLQKECPTLLQLEDNEQKAQYVLRYRYNKYYFTLPGNKFQPLVKPVDAGGEDTAQRLAGILKHIGSWEFIRNLSNKTRSKLVSDETLQVDISVGLNAPTYKIANDGDEIILNLEKVNGSWRNALRVKMTNLGERKLYCTCLWLSSNFGSFTDLLKSPVIFLEGSADKKHGSSPDVEALKYNHNDVIPVSLDKVVKWYNWPEQTEYLKFIISTEPFDVTALRLEGLTLPLVPGDKKEPDQNKGIGRGIGGEGFTENTEDWFTKQVKLVYPNPEYNTISKADKDSLLNYPDTAEIGLDIYFDPPNDESSVFTIKPSISVTGQDKKQAGV